MTPILTRILDGTPQALDSAILHCTEGLIHIESISHDIWDDITALWKHAKKEEAVQMIYTRLLQCIKTCNLEEEVSKRLKYYLQNISWDDLKLPVLTVPGWRVKDLRPGVIPVQDMMMDLRTGQTRLRVPNDLFTYTLAYPIDKIDELNAVKVDTFVRDLVGDNASSLFQRVLGYYMTGLTTETRINILYNEHYDNGKGLLENIFSRVYGKALVRAYPKFLEDERKDRRGKYWDEIKTKRVLMISHQDDVLGLSESNISLLTSRSFNTLILCNVIPKEEYKNVRAIKINRITHDVKTCQSYIEPKFLTAFLGWILRGAQMYYRQGFN